MSREPPSSEISFDRLSNETILHILQYLPFKQMLLNISCLSQQFYWLSKDPKLIPKSFLVPIFCSPNEEKNKQHRKEVFSIAGRACLLRMLSVEVDENCNLNQELQLVGSKLNRVSINP